jgi:SRSO17 transposase
MGLFGDGERKSVEPIAARACADPERVEDEHQRLCHFLVDSKWSDRDVRRFAARYGVDTLTAREPIGAWIVDDTGMLKQGSHSVGVQRQYTGSAGKVTNCQVAVSLSLATATEHLPVDFELYLPKSWTDDAKRRREARIPQEVVFGTKLDLALDMIDRAIEDNLPRGIVLVDTAYGNSNKFREDIRWRGLDYAVAVEGSTKVWLLDKLDRRHGEPTSLRALADLIALRGGFRRTTWREGTRVDLSARFAVRRVLPSHDDGWLPSQREPVWLLIEWPDGEAAPTKFYMLTLPKNATRKRMVRIVKQRWRTERVYEDLKGELGFDHYEGRRFPGWHHHVSVALSCYAFIVAERARRFSPSAGRTQADHPLQIAA